MSSFEFLSAFISVIVGLGVAHMLAGAVRLLHNRQTTRFSIAHFAWSLFTFLMIVVYWWTVVFGWKDWQDWNVVLFGFLLTYGMTLFVMSAILYPSDIPKTWDTHTHFVEIRRWFFGVNGFWIVLELCDTYLKGHFDDFSWPYFLMLGTWIITMAWGWNTTKRRSHTIIALYQLTTLVAWMGYQLRNLDWSPAVPG
jgi:hypothetical protein